MFVRKIVTLFCAHEHDAGQRVIDTHALRILEQELREAAAGVAEGLKGGRGGERGARGERGEVRGREKGREYTPRSNYINNQSLSCSDRM